MARPCIVVTGADLAPEALALLVDYEVVFAGRMPREDGVQALCRRHNPVAIIVRYGGVSAAIMDAAPALRVISRHGSGIDTIDAVAARVRGIAVCSTPGANAAAVAEHATALLLACAKSIKRLNDRMCAGHWDKATHKSLELNGRTLGIVGLGAIGLLVAKIFDALGMQVIGFDPRAPEAPGYIQRVDLESLWRRSDAITLHCPLTEATQHLVNRATIAQCKPGFILVNTARGGLVDEVALADALRSGQVSAAGLDCFQVEPPVAVHPLSTSLDVITTPHIAGLTRDAYVAMGTMAVRNAIAVLQGSLAR